MPNINLMPPPAFERSLVPAFMTNFNRIRDALLRTSSRIHIESVEWNGPWPKTTTVYHPFKSDCLIILRGSCWATGLGMMGLCATLDGVVQAGWAWHYFNEANSHKNVTSSSVIRGVAAGNHTWGIAYAPPAGGPASDGNDWGSIAFTMLEVN